MALWCRRKYHEYFIRERDAFDVPDIIAGEVYYGMIKEGEDDMMADMMHFIDQESTVMISVGSNDRISRQGPNEQNLEKPKSEKQCKSDSSLRYTDIIRNDFKQNLKKKHFGQNTPNYNSPNDQEVEAALSDSFTNSYNLGTQTRGQEKSEVSKLKGYNKNKKKKNSEKSKKEEKKAV